MARLDAEGEETVMADVLLVLAGLAALIGGAEMLVRGGTGLAAGLRISPVVIGATVVAIGTSAPELAIGIDAALRGSGALAVGNIAGTNTLNLLLIFGLMALLRPITLHSQVLRLDLPALVISSALLLGLALDGSFSVLDGVILVSLGVAYSALLVRAAHRESRDATGLVGVASSSTPPPAAAAQHRVRDVVLLITGIGAIVLGAQWLVDGAVATADRLGVTEGMVGLTIVAIGTSAPELVTAIVATLRRTTGIAVGNVLGSSIYNILVIFGITALVGGDRILVEPALVAIDLPVMLLAAVVCVPVILTDQRIRRLEGALMVGGYAVYLASLLFFRSS